MTNIQNNNSQHPSGTLPNPLSEVSVVILNWNGRDWLRKFLPSVLATNYPNTRIIVGDNASTDDSIRFLQENYPSIEIIQNETNEGFSKGYNSILKHVTSDYYVLLNSDIEVTPNWLNPIVELMESSAGIAVCQPKILSHAQKEYFEYAGAAGGWLDALGYPFARGRVFATLDEDKGQYDTVQDCFWASGAAMCVRASVYHALGGLDEFFFAHQEEIDFCWRVQLAGYRVKVQPRSVVYHIGGGTLPQGSSRKVFLNFRNNLVMMTKNMPKRQLVYKLPVRLVLDGVYAVKELFSGKGHYFMAVIKAHHHFFLWVLGSKNKAIFPKTRQGALQGYYRGSIVWQYFVKKKRHFEEIV